MVCLYFLTRNVYIVLLNHTLAVNLSSVNMRATRCNYPYMLKSYRNLKKCGLLIWFVLFMLRCRRLKQLNSLTTIDTFTCLGDRDTGLVLGSYRGNYVCFLFVVVVVVVVVNLLFGAKHNLS